MASQEVRQEEQAEGIQKTSMQSHTAEEKQMQQNKPPNKHFKDLSADEKKQYISTKVAECCKRKSRQMVQPGRNRDRERKMALIRPNDHNDRVAVEEEVGSQTGAEPWIPSTRPSTSRAMDSFNTTIHK